ncbi:MAG: uroporphyrinogen decarboxylase family protein [Eubacteriales bacterium]
MNLFEYIKNKNRRVIYPQMGAVGLIYTNYTMYDVYRDPEKQLEIARIIESRIPTDFTYPIDYGVVFIETLGVELMRPDYDFPSSINHPVRVPEDLYQLKQPSPYEDGLMPSYLEAIRLIAQTIDKPEMVALVGPFTLAGELMDLENLARCVLKNPGFVDAVLDFCMEAIIRFAGAVAKSGARVIQISEPSASLISPKHFKRFITPRLQKIFKAIGETDTGRVLHICGRTDCYLEEMISSGAQILSLDQIMDLANVAQIVPPQIIIAGNIDPVDIMLMGDVSLVKAAAEKLLQDMKPFPNFMPSFGCDCVLGSPEANIKAFIDTVYKGV